MGGHGSVEPADAEQNTNGTAKKKLVSASECLNGKRGARTDRNVNHYRLHNNNNIIILRDDATDFRARISQQPDESVLRADDKVSVKLVDRARRYASNILWIVIC